MTGRLGEAAGPGAAAGAGAGMVSSAGAPRELPTAGKTWVSSSAVDMSSSSWSKMDRPGRSLMAFLTPVASVQPKCR